MGIITKKLASTIQRYFTSAQNRRDTKLYARINMFAFLPFQYNANNTSWPKA